MNTQETQILYLFRAWIKEAIRFGNFELQKEVDDLNAHAKEGWALAGNRLNKLKELEQIIARKKADEDYAARPVKKPLTPISYLKLPRKVQKALENQGFQSIGDIIDNTDLELLKMRNFGKGGLAILKAELTRHGKTLSRLAK